MTAMHTRAFTVLCSIQLDDEDFETVTDSDLKQCIKEALGDYGFKVQDIHVAEAKA